MGAAWAQHAMCESAFTVSYRSKEGEKRIIIKFLYFSRRVEDLSRYDLCMRLGIG
jgi:hypothetical protein